MTAWARFLVQTRLPGQRGWGPVFLGVPSHKPHVIFSGMVRSRLSGQNQSNPRMTVLNTVQ